MAGGWRGQGDRALGNSFGVPVVGEAYFDECYSQNPLVNAFSAGILETGKMIRATAAGAGNPVYIIGSATGKDGIHGASFASKDLSKTVPTIFQPFRWVIPFKRNCYSVSVWNWQRPMR